MLVGLLAIYGLGLSFWLLPFLGADATPVLIYATIITLMAITAITARMERPWTALGAILLILSDSAIVIDKFLIPADGMSYFIWPSYYFAHLLIVTGTMPLIHRQKPA
jgi:uncharacterized membrane protein YhhN